MGEEEASGKGGRGEPDFDSRLGEIEATVCKQQNILNVHALRVYMQSAQLIGRRLLTTSVEVLSNTRAATPTW